MDITLITLSVFLGISFTRFVYLYFCKKRDFENQTQPYDIGIYLRSLRNKNVLSSLTQKKLKYNIKNQSKQPESQKNVLPLFPAMSDGILGASNVLHQYLCIDDYIYEGVSKLSNQTIDNFSDLSSQLKTYDHGFQGLARGGLNKIKGHIAESHVAKHFEQEGIEVNWPESSNQEGFDLLLNGNPIQVKCIENANNLVEHFQKYPKIPAIIPSDAKNIPEDAFYFNPVESVDNLFKYIQNTENPIIVDSQLSNAELTEQTIEGTDVALGAFKPVIPWVTVAFSGFREAKLLGKGDTDFLSSVKNIGLDAAGVGGGGTAGAVIGSMIFPGPGTVIGGFLGTFVGRAITNDIKQGPVKEAYKKVKRARRKIKKETKRVNEQYTEKLSLFKKSQQDKMNDKAQEMKNRIDKQVNDLRKWVVNQEKPSKTFKINLLKKIKNTTKYDNPKESNWTKYLWPSHSAIMSMAYQGYIQEHQRYFVEKFRKGQFKDKGELFQEFAKRGLCKNYIFSQIKKVEDQRKVKESELVKKIKQNQDQLLKLRYQSMKNFVSQVKKYTQQIQNELSPFVKEIKSHSNELKKEARKLGRKVA